MKIVEIYTDGACRGNPGVGGYGFVMLCGKHRKEGSKAFELTTNNRMELLAVIDSLNTLTEPCIVIVTSDSKYVTDAINKGWFSIWIRNGWKNSVGKLPNKDLWERLEILMHTHKITFVWVKGHAGHIHNERCDILANQVIDCGIFETDTEYTSKTRSDEKC